MKIKTVSGTMLTLLLTSMITLAFNIQPVKASGTIYIRPDGSIDPPSANITTFDNVTYTFTGNNYDGIFVERDNIVVDGAGYTLQGTGRGIGIRLSGRSNVTIKNTKIKSFDYGFWLYDSSNNTISGNNITNNGYGIQLDSSSNNTLRNNYADNNKYNFGVSGSLLSHYIQDIDDSNTVKGKPVYYWVNRQDLTVPLDGGYVALVDCTNITVQNLNLTNNGQGLLLVHTTNSMIIRNRISNNSYGMRARSSDYNRISGNNIIGNGDGIFLVYSSNNSISGNNITNNRHGLFLFESSNNTISENNIETNRLQGILISDSSYNTISGNNITENDWGLTIGSPNNTIYHNNFVNNTRQLWTSDYHKNVWDNGYPSGGNYWSDLFYPLYLGYDFYSGPYQNETSSDGIVDFPYIILWDNNDNYPLVNPWTPSAPTVVATVDVVPDTLNLKSKGKWITCYVELPEGYSVSDIDVSTIKLNNSVSAVLHPAEIGDYDDDGIPDLMVKFDRASVIDMLSVDETALTITGEANGTHFEGSDSIRIVFPSMKIRFSRGYKR